MASRNSRTNRPTARSSRAPQSARAVRSAKAAQSGRIAPRGTAEQFSRGNANSSAYRSAYTPGSQGRSANTAYSRQTAASQYSRDNPQYSRNAGRRMGRGKKIAIGVLAAVLVAVVGCGTAFALYINSINDQLTHGNKTQEEIDLINDQLAPAKSFTEPFYMMLIGSDRLDDKPEEGARSDTNIVVRVDPVNNLATMVSIPRDTKIEIDGYGTNKFNAAYNYGGAAGAIREASQLLNVDISHYAEVNFEELKALVDAVGGVDVEVTELVDDPDADGTSAHPEWPRVIIEEGEQHLDGNQALVFARSRAYADGDFTRTANQRKLIMAIVNKVLALPVTELPGVIQSAANAVTTDLRVSDIVGLAQQFKDGGELTVYSAMVPSSIQETRDANGVLTESYVINDVAATKEMMGLVEAGKDPSTVVSTMSPETGTGVGSSTGTGYGDASYYDDSYYDPNAATGNGTGAGTDYYDPYATGANDANEYVPGATDGTGTGVYDDGTGTGDGYGDGGQAGTYGAPGDGTY